MLYRTGDNLSDELSNFIANSNNLSIFVPYIKLEPLKQLINCYDNITAVYVRWKPHDLILGASDLEVYLYLRSRNIPLYRNTRIHLKAFVDDNKRCFLGSANISSRALNLPESNNFNFELATISDKLSIADLLYFSQIKDSSLLITDNIYSQFCEQLPSKDTSKPQDDDFNIIIDGSEKDFLISSLPMSYSFEEFEDIYFKQSPSSQIELNCFLHDLTLYKIPLGLSRDEFYLKVKTNFFNHRFILEFLKVLEEAKEMRFGAVQNWIHRNCADAPIPRRWEITQNIQILYRWIISLAEGRYRIFRPNHTEILQVVG
jgi:hypothetical protein